MRKITLLALLAGFFTLNLQAQEQGIIRATAGLAYGTEISEVGINIGGEYLITDNISGGLSYTSFFVPDPLSFSSFNIDGRYYFLTDGPYVYGLLGIGIVSSKVDLGPFGTASGSDTGLNLGGGAYFPISEQISINGQLKYNTVGSGQLVFQGGIAYSFNL